MRCAPVPAPPEGRETITEKGGAVCTVAQLAVVPDAAAEGGMKAMPTEHDGVVFNDGWFYDDFSRELETAACTRLRGREVAARRVLADTRRRRPASPSSSSA